MPHSLATAHRVAFEAQDVASQVRIVQDRLRTNDLSREHVALAAGIGNRASQCVLGVPEAEPRFEALAAAMTAQDVKARALIAMARLVIAEWHRQQDEPVCDAARAGVAYDPEQQRIAFTPPIGVRERLERPYYKDYSTHYVVRTGTGDSYGIWKWGGDDRSDWVKLGPSVGAVDATTLTRLSVRRATWIRDDQDLAVTTDSDGWTRFTWWSEGAAVGSISTHGGGESLRLDGLIGTDTTCKVLWAAEKCVLCPCTLHAAVCNAIDSFASGWRSRWSAITGACLAAAALVPSEQQVLERWDWPYPTLTGNLELSPPELDHVVTELTLWALGLADPVAEDVERLERDYRGRSNRSP